jgi:RNA polymerase sigma factor (sigma-70 family)
MTRPAFAAAALAAALALPAGAEDLTFAHFMPATSWQHEALFTAWEQAVEDASGGRLDVTVFPAQTLGKAPQGYDNARDGIADIAWTVQGYTAGRFPLSQIVELPGLFDTAEIGSCAFQKLYDSGALDAEYADTHVLFVHTHGPGHLHTRDRAVTRLSDLEGLKIRRPTAVIGQLLEELGAEPVGMPAPAIYEAASRGTIDGFMLPWEAVEGFRAYEVADHHTRFGFYALAFLIKSGRVDTGFQKLVDEYQQKLYWHIRRMVIHHEDANDVLQNTFIKIYKNLHKFKAESKLYTWMYRIATNESISYLQKNKKNQLGHTSEDLFSLEESLKADSYFDEKEVYIALQKAISLLPAKQKAVFSMRYYDELSYKDISQILDTSIGALKASYHHAVNKVETYLKSNISYVE